MGNQLTFGELVDKRISELNISMRELARRAEVDVAYISKIIKNKSVNPSYQVTMKIANALSISQRELEKIFNLDTENIEDVITNNEKSLTYEEKDKVKDIVSTLIDSMHSTDETLLEVADIIKKIDELRKLTKGKTSNKKYYIINYFSKDEISIFQTNYIDDELLRLYCLVLNCKADDCFIVEGDIKTVPRAYKEASFTTLDDVIDIAVNLNEDDDLYDEFTNLRNYIEKIL